jgi:uncharacterized protein
MKNILIAGGSGLVGQQLIQGLQKKNYSVGILSRSKSNDSAFKSFEWNPATNKIDPEAINFADAIINLSGANVGTRWTEKKKLLITESRTKSNEVLIDACQKLNKWPSVYLSAGGANYYGDCGDEILTEEHPNGSAGFLPHSTYLWENAVNKWRKTDVRVVQYRMGIVLSSKGGALPKMAMTLPIGVLPIFGTGTQWVSWIHIRDMAELFLFALENAHVQGVYNAGSPNALRHHEFQYEMALAYGKKHIKMRLPEILLKIILGEMRETLLSSVRISSERIQKSGFVFQYPILKEAILNLRETDV